MTTEASKKEDTLLGQKITIKERSQAGSSFLHFTWSLPLSFSTCCTGQCQTGDYCLNFATEGPHVKMTATVPIYSLQAITVPWVYKTCQQTRPRRARQMSKCFRLLEVPTYSISWPTGFPKSSAENEVGGTPVFWHTNYRPAPAWLRHLQAKTYNLQEWSSTSQSSTTTICTCTWLAIAQFIRVTVGGGEVTAAGSCKQQAHTSIYFLCPWSLAGITATLHLPIIVLPLALYDPQVLQKAEGEDGVGACHFHIVCHFLNETQALLEFLTNMTCWRQERANEGVAPQANSQLDTGMNNSTWRHLSFFGSQEYCKAKLALVTVLFQLISIVLNGTMDSQKSISCWQLWCLKVHHTLLGCSFQAGTIVDASGGQRVGESQRKNHCIPNTIADFCTLFRDQRNQLAQTTQHNTDLNPRDLTQRPKQSSEVTESC